MAGTSMMDRRPFVAGLLADRGDLLVVTGLGSSTYDVAACGDHPLNFYLWSAMGSTAMVGLGLAMARPERRVAVITGDGDVLMALGSLATIGVKQPGNLSIVVLDDRHYSATGMQPTATAAGIDLAGTAESCRFRRVERVSALDSAPAMRDLLHTGQGPIFIHARVEADDQKRIIPSRDGYAIKQRFMQASMAQRS
jgi:thiamine pyrophosphate-dependent acetolactate synthase large subunit-like protein